MSEDKIVSQNELEKRRQAANKADKYIAKDGSPPKLAAIGLMSPVEYAQQRAAMADRLDVPKSFLDEEYRAHRRKKPGQPTAGRDLMEDPDPWPDEVNGAILLTDISRSVSSHLILPAGAADAIALWVLFSHAHNCFQISPLLAITSPSPECGKTTLMTFLTAVVRLALPASNITPASLFRAVDKWHPSLLIDEADTFLKDNDELRGIIDSGHNKQFAFLIRTVGDDHEPQRFSTWSPKAIAFIGKIHATLGSRSVSIKLKKKLPSQQVVQLRPDKLLHLEPLLRKAARWAADHADALKAGDPNLPSILQSRSADNWRPLIAIADQAGGDWPARARRVAETSAAEGAESIASVLVLEDVFALFKSRGAEAILSRDIVDHLNAIEDRPWGEWNRGKGISKHGLANVMGSFEIRSAQVWENGKNLHGYKRDHVQNAFTPYLPARSLDALQGKELRGKQNARAEDGLAFQKGGNRLQANGSSDLAGKNPQKSTLGDNDPFASLKDASLALSDDYPELPPEFDRRGKK